MKLPKLLILYFFSGIAITDFCFANDATVILDSAYSFADTRTPGELNISLQDIQFSPHKHQDFNFGITNKYCYIVIKVQSDEPLNSYILSIENTSLDTVLIYKLSGNADKQLLYQGGNHIEYDPNRVYIWHTIPLTITEKPDYYLIAIRAQSKNVNVTYDVVKKETLQNRYQFFDRLIFFYLGAVSLIVMGSLTGLLLFKNRAFFIFPCYILAVSTWILAHYGYLYSNLYTLYLPINEIAKPVSFLLGAFFSVWLLTAMFGKDLKEVILGKALFGLKLFNLSLLGLGFIYLIWPFPAPVFIKYNIAWHFSILLSVCTIFTTLIWLYKRSKAARLFFLSVFTLLLMVLFQLFANIGVFQSSFLSDHGVLFASLFQMLLLTYGIFYSIWEERKWKDRQLLILEEEQTKALQMLVQVQERERKRIAEDLHDSIGPMLSAIKINFLRIIKAKRENVSFIELVAKTESIIDDTITEIRNVSHQLIPKNLSSKGLITTLSDYFKDLETIYTTTIYFTHDVANSIHEEVQLTLYRIISELVLNAAKHSCSKVISISIITNCTVIQIQVRDVGKGFNPTQNNNNSLGLKNIKSRIAYMKGSLSIESSDRVGTLFKILIPQ